LGEALVYEPTIRYLGITLKEFLNDAERLAKCSNEESWNDTPDKILCFRGVWAYYSQDFNIASLKNAKLQNSKPKNYADVV